MIKDSKFIFYDFLELTVVSEYELFLFKKALIPTFNNIFFITKYTLFNHNTHT